MFFNALPTKGLARKGRRAQGGKKSKQRVTVAFFVSADGAKVGKPMLIWRSKNPRCFKRIGGSSKLKSVWYYCDKKSWLQVEIRERYT